MERVTYYDPLGRKVLKEFYAEHQLTRLELFEYLEPINVPTIKWLFVRGDYLSCTEKKLASDKKVSYYFSPRPAVEWLAA